MATGAWACSGERIRLWLPRQEQVPRAKQPEEQQIRIAQRISLIQYLPKGVYGHGRDGAEDKIQECIICWMDFVHRDPI
ncbi:RING finger protein 11 [Myotis brandtii]|uniref:RING finger protein 11 n=1 Tax=Myotis brandtii TaxID=109478 RepID=S7MRS2_MYOBR|nr:RING finger protein 11 [Myotis brandtii]